MRIEQKWGFGMAPPFAEIQREREQACRNLILIIEEQSLELAGSSLAEISLVKGLFTRVWKQDQWDYFTVWTQLGRLGRKKAKTISFLLRDLRVSAKEAAQFDFENSVLALRQENFTRYLKFFLNEMKLESKGGYIYILSTREQRDVLKIGYTERTVEERIKEINSSTGVVIPYGCRAVWTVENASVVEKEIHAIFSDERIRNDREFFKIDFYEAFGRINDFIRSRNNEL
jgi:hypothetical protein